jgi:hypothetical protein
MRILVIFLFILSSTLIDRPDFSFIIKNNIDITDLWHQSPNKIKSLLGKPDSIEYVESKIDILTYYSIYKYKDLHLELVLSCSSSKNKSKRLVSTITVKNLIEDYSILKEDIICKYGNARYTKNDKMIYYFENTGQRVDLFFKNDYLLKIDIGEY